MTRHGIREFVAWAILASLFVTVGVFGAVWAADMASSIEPGSEWGWNDLAVQLGLLVSAFLVLGGGVAVLDRWRQRAYDATALRLRVADSMSRHPVLSGLPISVAAHPPLWPSAPITVQVRGHVPGPGLRNLAHALVERELARDPHASRLDDRIQVDTPLPRAA